MELSKKNCRVWCDASSLAIGVVIECDGNIVEDGCWLRKTDDCQHINVSELDSVIKGVSLALKWDVSSMEIMTDSASVFYWLNTLLYKDKKLRISGLSELLIRRRLAILEEAFEQLKFNVSIHKVASIENIADRLTRVPKKWLNQKCLVGCVKSSAQNEAEELLMKIKDVHDRFHGGVNRTKYVFHKVYPSVLVSNKSIEKVVKNCEKCLSIDPSPIKWDKGDLEVSEIWQRAAMDVTHFEGCRF